MRAIFRSPRHQALMALCLIAFAAVSPSSPAEASNAAQDTPNEYDRRILAGQAIGQRIEAGAADAAADAALAAGRGEFGLVVGGRFRSETPGISCFTPLRQPPRVAALLGWGDSIGEREMRLISYASTYNRVIVERPDYPDADLCRPDLQQDHAAPGLGDWPVDRAARPVDRPPLSLHEAARRGSAADVRRWLRSVASNGVDGLGMTPLAWAVARDNRPAVRALLAAGADPWASGANGDHSAVYWAAALGRAGWFQRLAARPGRPFAAWSPWHLSAALAGGSEAIVARMVAEPHEPLRIEMVRRPLPAPRLLEPFLREAPALADALLLRAIQYDARPDIVRLALDHGASANARGPHAGSDTALDMAAKGIEPASVEIVDMLLRAGADPNLESHRTRPLWTAVRTLSLNHRVDEIDARATAIFHRLVAAGADLNLPDDLGRPPVWFLIFRIRWAPERLDGHPSPQLLEMLVRAGLDLNAVWNGKRVLTLVDEQAGRESELATTLRRLGATH